MGISGAAAAGGAGAGGSFTAGEIIGGAQGGGLGTAGAAATSGGVAGLLGGAGVAKTVAGGIIGFDGIMVWMASDNILTGTTFTLKKLREARKAGVITKKEANKVIDGVQTWIDSSVAFVTLSATLNPIIFPFKKILLINAEKAQLDFDLEKKLINKL